ncbi:MAG: sensor histidine kinase [Vicinamibacterales bacterium]
MPTLTAFTDALAALERLGTQLPVELRPALADIVANLRLHAAHSRQEAAQLAAAQAEALVNSAIIVSELENTREELRLAAHEAESASRAKSAFVANMSHELRTPLNAVIGYAELALEQAHDEGLEWVAHDLGRIRDSGRHLLALVNNVLDISKIEAGRVDLEVAPFAVAELIQTLSHDFGMLAQTRGLQFSVAVSGETGTLVSDYTRVRQVLTNLLGNACKFTSEGSVTLHVDAADSDVAFTVRDTGIGMSADQLKHLFVRFHQADVSTTRLYGGSGLGLHLSRELVHLLGGQIAVRSEPGVGTTVVVDLPRTAPSHVQAATAG